MYQFHCTGLLELASTRKELFLAYTPFFSPLNKKFLRLLNINLFIKFSIQKCLFNIKLKYLPFLLCNNNNYSSNCLQTSNWRDSLIKINTWFLRGASSNKPQIVSLYISFLIEFDFVNPFQTYNLFLWVGIATSSQVLFSSFIRISCSMAFFKTSCFIACS